MINKNILYIGGFKLPDKNAAAHRVLNNARILRMEGYNVDFIGIDDSNNEEFINFSESKMVDGFNFWNIKSPIGKIQTTKHVTSIKILKSFLLHREYKYNYVILYNFPSLCTYKLIKLGKSFGFKVIGDITEWYDHDFKSLSNIVKLIDSETRMRYVNHKLDGIICISSLLYNYYKNENRILLPPLVDSYDEKYRKENSDTFNDCLIRLIYAGSPGKDKDKLNVIIQELLKIENIEKKVILTIVGLSKIDYFKIYPNHTRYEKEISEFINFLGILSHIATINLIKKSDFSIFLRESKKSNMAGFPTKFAESISCGTPVLTNKTSDLENYLIDGENGYFLDSDKNLEGINNLQEIIMISRKDIESIKNTTLNAHIFDYRLYNKEFSFFLNNL